MAYRRQRGGFTDQGRLRLGRILRDARRRQGGNEFEISCDEFAEIVNDHWGIDLFNTWRIWRLENGDKKKPDTEELTRLQPFTWSEIAGRPYTVEELIAIGKEQLDPNDIGKVTPLSPDPAVNGNQ